MVLELLQKLKSRRVKGLATSTLWQMMPALSSALLSLVVVKWFSFEVWGGVVAVIALQQIVNVVAAWGSKDFLQKSYAASPANFKEIFGVNFYSRLIFLLLLPIAYSMLGSHSTELLIWFSVLIFSRFVQQSTEVLVLINKRFSSALLIDCSILLIQLGTLFWCFQSNNSTWILAILAGGMLLKSIFYWLQFNSYFAFVQFDFQAIKVTLPFALLAISGFLISRVDLVVLKTLVTAETLGKYQVVIALLWNLQAIAQYVSAPFAHHFYKSSADSKANLTRLLFKVGLTILPLALVGVYLFLLFVYNIDIELNWLFPMFIFSFASFVYIPSILSMYLHNKAYYILTINIVANILIIGALFVAQNVVQLSVFALLWIVALHQATITLGYWLANKFTSVRPE